MVGTYQQYLAYNKKQGLNSASEDAYNKYNKLGSSSGAPVGVAGEGRVPLTGGSQLNQRRTGKGITWDESGGGTSGVNIPGVDKYDPLMKKSLSLIGLGSKRGVRGIPQDYNSAENLPAGVSMIFIPGMGKVRSDAIFEGDNAGYAGNKGQTRTAADIANIMAGGNYEASRMSGFVTSRNSDDSWRVGTQNFKSAVAPQAPAAATAFRAPKSKVATPAPAPFKQTKPTQKERNEITPPAKGLEDTIKTPPRLLSERRKRSVLTSKDNRRTYF